MVGGEEDGVANEINEQLYTTPEDALATVEALGTGEKGRYMAALTFGNVHGVYKPGNVKLRPEILKTAQEAVVEKLGLEAGSKPFDLVFHGGSGSTAEEIGAAVDYGVIKMNVDTDTQYAFTRPVAAHMFTNYDGVLKVDGEVGNKKTYDPRAWGKAGRGRHGRARRRGVREPPLLGHVARLLTNSEVSRRSLRRPPQPPSHRWLREGRASACTRNLRPALAAEELVVRRRAGVAQEAEQRSHSSVSPIACADSASTARQRRKPRFGSCSHGTGPCPFQPLRRSRSRLRW